MFSYFWTRIISYFYPRLYDSSLIIAIIIWKQYVKGIFKFGKTDFRPSEINFAYAFYFRNNISRFLRNCLIDDEGPYALIHSLSATRAILDAHAALEAVAAMPAREQRHLLVLALALIELLAA